MRLVRIGEFARLGSVSVPSLRYYHDRGLLVPVHVDPATGYRWYSAAQLTRLTRIAVLKELGFTVDQIERVIAEITVAELRAMLLLRRTQLEADIAADQGRLAQVEQRLRSIEKEGDMPGFDIVVKPLPARHVATIGGRPQSWESDHLRAVLEPAYARLLVLLAENHLQPTAPAFDFYEGGPEHEHFMAYAAVPVADTVTTLAAPALVADLPAVGSALSAIVAEVTVGTFNEVYGAFGRWAEDHGAELVGGPREGLVTAARPADNRDVVLELVWPLRMPGAPMPDIAAVFGEGGSVGC